MVGRRQDIVGRARGKAEVPVHQGRAHDGLTIVEKEIQAGPVRRLDASHAPALDALAGVVQLPVEDDPEGLGELRPVRELGGRLLGIAHRTDDRGTARSTRACESQQWKYGAHARAAHRTEGDRHGGLYPFQRASVRV
jgi:hypothetical protein